LLSGDVLPELLRDILGKDAECRFQAKGHSMSPFIKDGDVVTISPLSGSSPRLGDVVAFNHPEAGKLVIHRIVREKGDFYLVRGENAFEADGYIEKRDILGFVTAIDCFSFTERISSPPATPRVENGSSLQSSCNPSMLRTSPSPHAPPRRKRGG